MITASEKRRIEMAEDYCTEDMEVGYNDLGVPEIRQVIVTAVDMIGLTYIGKVSEPILTLTENVSATEHMALQISRMHRGAFKESWRRHNEQLKIAREEAARASANEFAERIVHQAYGPKIGVY